MAPTRPNTRAQSEKSHRYGHGYKKGKETDLAKWGAVIALRCWGASYGQISATVHIPETTAKDIVRHAHLQSIKNGSDPLETKEETKLALEEEWKAISVEVVNSLVESMPGRVKQVLENNGGNNFHG